MPVTFQGPPNWPAAPVGFIPPTGWQPEPSWGPAPAGWVFYTDNGIPVAPPPGAWLPPVPQAPPAPQTPQQAPYPQQTPGNAPGTPATPGPSFAQSEPPKKSRLGLIIGIIIGALVVVVGVAVLVFFLFFDKAPAPTAPATTPAPAPATATSKSPDPTVDNSLTLTSAQFDKLFAKGDAFMGSEISLRNAGDPATAQTSDPCGTEINKVLVSADDWVAAVTADGLTIVSAGRFEKQSVAEAGYETIAAACVSKAEGMINGAPWLSVTLADATGSVETVVMLCGNVTVMGAVDPTSTLTVPRLASEMQAEIADAARG